MTDELRRERHKRLAQRIAQIADLKERTASIIKFGDARYQEGIEQAYLDIGQTEPLEKEEPPTID